MAKKKAKDPYLNTLVELQKMQNNSAKSIQAMVDKSNQAQMAFNSSEAQKARDWEAVMSNTSHQREVKDLKAAGLNPVLSVNQGANSYTTSSASTNNDSGASAAAGIYSQALGAISNFESSRMQTEATIAAANQSAAATKYAADQTAAASRFAAAQNSAAAKYAADRSYQAYKYNTDIGYQSAKEERVNKRWIATHQTAGSWAGLVDKTLEQYGIRGAAKKVLRNSFGLIPSGSAKKMFKNSNPTKNYFVLRTQDTSNIKQDLKGQGIKPTNANVRLYVKARVFGDKSALEKLIKQTPDYGFSRKSGGGFF